MEVGCAVSRAWGIACCAFRKTKGSEGAVRTETAIVSVVWLVVSGNGGVIACYRGIDEVPNQRAFPKLEAHPSVSRDR